MAMFGNHRGLPWAGEESPPPRFDHLGWCLGWLLAIVQGSHRANPRVADTSVNDLTLVKRQGFLRLPAIAGGGRCRSPWARCGLAVSLAVVLSVASGFSSGA